MQEVTGVRRDVCTGFVLWTSAFVAVAAGGQARFSVFGRDLDNGCAYRGVGEWW